MEGRHPTVTLDEVVHQRVRLGILAVLHGAGAADFTYLKQILEVTDGNLKRHLDVLVDAAFVTSAPGRPLNGRRRTVVTVTDAGRRAFEQEMAHLQRLAGAVADDQADGHAGESSA